MQDMFHGGITDLKYVPKTIKHIYSMTLGKNMIEPCILKLYFGLIQSTAKDISA